MKLNPCCMNCQLRKQEAKIRHFDDEDRKKQYMEAIRRRFDNPKEGDCVPSISTELKKFYAPATTSISQHFRRSAKRLPLPLSKAKTKILWMNRSTKTFARI